MDLSNPSHIILRRLIVMSNFKTKFLTRKWSYPALALVALAFLFGGMLLASSLNTGSKVQAGTTQIPGISGPQSFAISQKFLALL